ncbi:MAG: exodeoxyribonuclease V subunit gamma [Thermodesulfobacteria bacterium]|nr:exodeoxyribonuclease V subunit gamma [Thermodesulfobacteriota bacterium]
MEGFFLYRSNCLETLADRLTDRLAALRRSSFAMRPDLILVNNYEMAQWLSIHMAERLGICANIQFKLVGSWMWELAGSAFHQSGHSEEDDTIGRERLRWLIYSVLSGLEPDPKSYGELSEMMDSSSWDGLLGAYELSGQLAQVFDRYMNYCYPLLDDWLGKDLKTLHADERWQAALWRALVDRADDRFKMSRLRGLIQGLLINAGESSGSGAKSFPGLSGQLPEIINLFGISYLPPLHLEIIQALSQITRVECYHLVPCRHYWADVVPERKRLELSKRFNERVVDEYFSAGNELLASLGQEGRKFQEALYALDSAGEEDLWKEPKEKTLLSAIQQSILDMTGLDAAASKLGLDDISSGLDDSVEFHSCHSRLREVEVLHDRLVDAFIHDPSLSPRDVLVMAPDIADYAQFIEAVFSAAPEERSIPYSIGDLGTDRTSEAVQAFVMLLDTVIGEFTAPELVDLLSHPIISSRFGLGAEGLHAITQWVRESGTRRGVTTLSEGSSCTSNTWLFGLDRLMATALMAETGPVEICTDASVKPLDAAIEGSGIETLGALSSFFFSLFGLARKFSGPDACNRSPGEWLDIFVKAVQDFMFDPSDSAGNQAQELFGYLDELFGNMMAAGVEELSPQVVIRAIKDHFRLRRPQRTFITGRVLFSSLVPMRALPFKIVCLMGMNHGEFPRNILLPSYDLTTRKTEFKARNRKDEDRYLFLETIMSARERLIVTFVGRRQTDNQELPPSTVVSELLREISSKLSVDASKLVTEHPLQPFGMAYLAGKEPRLKTYATEWLPIDRDGRIIKKETVKPIAPWPSDFHELLDMNGQQRPDRMDLWEIESALGHPVRHFLRNILSVNVNIGQETLEADESYSLGYFEEQNVVKALVEAVLKGRKPDEQFFSEIFSTLVLEGVLPNTGLARQLWNCLVTNKFSGLLEAVLEAGLTLDAAQISCCVEMERHDEARRIFVEGETKYLDGSGGLVDINLKVNERAKIKFWLRYLLWCLTSCKDKTPGPGAILTLSKGGKEVCMEAVPRCHAPGFSKPIIELVARARTGLIPFWPQAAYYFAKTFQNKPKKAEIEKWAPVTFADIVRDEAEKTAAKVLETLEGNMSFGSGFKDPWLMYLTRGSSLPPEDFLRHEEFWRASIEICAPMFWAMTKGR